MAIGIMYIISAWLTPPVFTRPLSVHHSRQSQLLACPPPTAPQPRPIPSPFHSHQAPSSILPTRPTRQCWCCVAGSRRYLALVGNRGRIALFRVWGVWPIVDKTMIAMIAMPGRRMIGNQLLLFQASVSLLVILCKCLVDGR